MYIKICKNISFLYLHFTRVRVLKFDKDLYISPVHCSVDYEDIRGQRVSHHAAEAEYVSEMSGRQRLPHQAGRSG